MDPKSIVCEYYRHGQCTKGFKCKFSHDLSVERKTAKIDLYTDKWVALCQCAFLQYFSHNFALQMQYQLNLSVERKTAKIDLYTDRWVALLQYQFAH